MSVTYSGAILSFLGKVEFKVSISILKAFLLLLVPGPVYPSFFIKILVSKTAVSASFTCLIDASKASSNQYFNNSPKFCLPCFPPPESFIKSSTASGVILLKIGLNNSEAYFLFSSLNLPLRGVKISSTVSIVPATTFSNGFLPST